MNIFEKMAAIMSEIEYLSKDDAVEFGKTKYKAISEEKVTSVVRASLVKQKLVIFPVKQVHTREGTLTTVDVTYRIVNAENPEESIEVVSSGTGVDTQDKGVGKAMTYAYKYMLLRTFAIPTGEDPDKIASEQLDAQQGQDSNQNGKDQSNDNRNTGNNRNQGNAQNSSSNDVGQRIQSKKNQVAGLCKKRNLAVEQFCRENGVVWNTVDEHFLDWAINRLGGR